MTEAVMLAPTRYVTIKLASQLIGLTVKAIESKIARGTWIEGRQFRRQDGNIYVDLRGVEQWVEKGTA
jgi:hypothetical protein